MHIKCIFHFASVGMQTLRIRGATKYEDTDTLPLIGAVGAQKPDWDRTV